MNASARFAVGTVLVLPAALTLYFGFNSGGFFVILAIGLAVRVTLAESPFAGLSKLSFLAVVALAAYALWTLISGFTSGAPARALLEYDRVLLYLLALVLLGSFSVSDARLEVAVRALAAAVLVICLAGLVSRLAPDVVLAPPSAVDERLSYPVSYWNALGLLAVFGVILCLHLTAGGGQPRLVRALGAGAIPPLAVVLLLTFSRGAIAAGAVALVVYLLAARPWALLGTTVTVVPLTAIALIAAYRAELLATSEPTIPSAVAQGHHLALVVALCRRPLPRGGHRPSSRTVR